MCDPPSIFFTPGTDKSTFPPRGFEKLWFALSAYACVRVKKQVHILSCNLCSPVKRIHLIVQTLHHLGRDLNNNKEQRRQQKTPHSRTIHWTHIGDGIEKETVTKMAADLLPGMGITYFFAGQLANHKVLALYRDRNIDCFINTSESEGLPVSIMEALSFSIPIIATDVGGIREILSEKNGIILSPDPLPGEIAESIKKILGMDKKQMISLRREAHRVWDTMVNAEKNYPAFVHRLQELINIKTSE